MVLVGVGGQGGEDRRVDVDGVGREQRLVAQVHEGLVGVVAQELLDVLGQAELVVEVLGVLLLVVVELHEQLEGVVLELGLALGRGLAHGELVLVADVVAVDGLVTDDEADEVGGVGQLGVAGPVHGGVEAGVEEEGLQHGGGDLALLGVVAAVVVQDDAGLALKVRVLLAPAEGLVDLRRRDEGGEDRGVGAGVDRLHEGDVGEHRLLVGGAGVRDEGDRADRALDRVQQRQAGEDAGGHVLLGLVEGGPGLHVVGQRHLLGQPEVAGEAVPDLEVLVVGQAVPVDGLDAVDQLDGLVHQFLPRFG